jgi:polar amino acid transport system substrate-binding protein
MHILRLPAIRRGAVALTVASLAVAGTMSVASAAGKPRSTPTATYNASAAKLVPAAIVSISKAGGVVEAFDASYPPDEFLASNNTTIIGFDADLGAAIATTLGLKFKPTNIPFGTIITGIQDGRVQIGNSSFTDTKAREKQVNFVDYFKAGEAFYVGHSSSIKVNGLASLCSSKKYVVAVEQGTTEESDAQTQAKKCSSADKLTVNSYQTQDEANLAVSSGRAQIGFADSQVAGYIVAQSNGAFKLSGSAIEVAPYGIAVSKSSADKGFDSAIEAAINALIKSGVYASILKHWGVSAGGVSKASLNGATS